MKYFILLLSSIALICVACAEQPLPRKILLKVNLGGGPVADFLGEDQVLETEGLQRTSTTETIKNTDQQEVFRSQRFARHEDFVMRIPVSDGIYSLTLLFAETYKKACVPGGRVFDISIGTPISGTSKIVEGFDLFQAAGCNSAYGKRFDKVPSKGGIVVYLKKRNQHPSLSGFIVEGFPLPKGDGSEYRPVGQPQQEEGVDGGNVSSEAPPAAPAAPAPLGAPGIPPPDAPPVAQPLGGAEAPVEPPSALSPLEGAIPPGELPQGAHPPGVIGEAAGIERGLMGLQPTNAQPVMTEGQQATHMAQQHQTQGQAADIGQSNHISPDNMGPLPGQVPQTLGNPELLQHPHIGGAVEQQVSRV